MTEVVPYEQRLNQNRRWALMEGSMHFEKGSEVFRTMMKLSQRLDELEIPYAVVGGMAMFQHGYQRFTSDVDILVTAESLQRIHEKLDGLGYLPPFNNSRNLRDTETGVRIEFLITGGFPGDGLPKPVSFPDPMNVAVVIDGIRVIDLPRLLELKLASGMTNPNRLKDLADAQELIKTCNLDEQFAEQLHPYVREKFLEFVQLQREHREYPQ